MNLNKNLSDEIAGSCVICLDDMMKSTSMHLKCKHIFHHKCIREWIMQLIRHGLSPSCPNCRRNIDYLDVGNMFFYLKRSDNFGEMISIDINSNDNNNYVEDNSPNVVNTIFIHEKWCMFFSLLFLFMFCFILFYFSK